MTTPDAEAPPCGLIDHADGGAAPAPDGEATPGITHRYAIDLRVFASAAEAQAFEAGYQAADGSGYLRRGTGDLAQVAVISRAGSGLTVTDQGGLDALRASRCWSALRSLADPDRPPQDGPIAVEIPTDGAPPRITVAGRAFTVTGDADSVTLQVAHAIPTHLIKSQIWHDRRTQDELILVESGEVRWLTDLASLITRPDTLRGIVEGLDAAEAAQRLASMAEWVRRDPAHLKIPTLMRAGWRLFRWESGASLFPPDDVSRPSRTISGAMLARLVQADLIRTPVRVRLGYVTGPYTYEIGSAADHALRSRATKKDQSTDSPNTSSTDAA